MRTVWRVFAYLKRYPWMAAGTLSCAILSLDGREIIRWQAVVAVVVVPGRGENLLDEHAVDDEENVQRSTLNVQRSIADNMARRSLP